MQKQAIQRTFLESDILQAVSTAESPDEWEEAGRLVGELWSEAFDAVGRVLASEATADKADQLRELTAGPDQDAEIAFWLTPAGKIESGE